MNALITSFQRMHDLGKITPVYSAAVYQPKGVNLEKAEWADIRAADGSGFAWNIEDGGWIRPRAFLSFPNPLAAYHQALLHHYERRHDQIKRWLTDREPFWSTFALICWCPYERRAREQLAEHGSFVCHTAVIAEVLEKHHGVRVWLDTDRQKMKALP